VLTLVVNIIARWFVVRGARGHRRSPGAAAEAVAVGVGEAG
jgi:hypothetical protein